MIPSVPCPEQGKHVQVTGINSISTCRSCSVPWPCPTEQQRRAQQMAATTGQEPADIGRRITELVDWADRLLRQDPRQAAVRAVGSAALRLAEALLHPHYRREDALGATCAQCPAEGWPCRTVDGVERVLRTLRTQWPLPTTPVPPATETAAGMPSRPGGGIPAAPYDPSRPCPPVSPQEADQAATGANPLSLDGS